MCMDIKLPSEGTCVSLVLKSWKMTLGPVEVGEKHLSVTPEGWLKLKNRKEFTICALVDHDWEEMLIHPDDVNAIIIHKSNPYPAPKPAEQDHRWAEI